MQFQVKTKNFGVISVERDVPANVQGYVDKYSAQLVLDTLHDAVGAAVSNAVTGAIRNKAGATAETLIAAAHAADLHARKPRSGNGRAWAYSEKTKAKAGRTLAAMTDDELASLLAANPALAAKAAALCS